MTEIGLLLASGLTGAVAGCIYFAGLWSTTQQMMTSQRPVMAYSISLLMRLSLLLIGMWLLIQIGLSYFVSAVVGFFLARSSIAAVIGLANRGPLWNSRKM